MKKAIEERENGVARGWQPKQGRSLWYLKKIPLLASLSVTDWERIQRSASMWEIRRRTVVYLPGDPAESVFFVNGGRVKISRVTPDGREITLRYQGAGDFFGEQSLFTGKPRGEMAETMETSLVTEVPRPVIEHLVGRRNELMRRFLKIILDRQNQLETRIQRLLFGDVRSKLAELLLELADQHGTKEEDGTVRIRLRITHQEIANLIGSTRETVSLTISEFRRQGYIRTDRRQLFVVDKKSLEAMII